MILESCLPIFLWVNHDWCFQGLTTLRILLGENENTYLPIQNSQQSGPCSCFSNLIFFPCSIHIFYYWHTHLQNIFCTSHGVYLFTISLSWRLFLSVFFSFVYVDSFFRPYYSLFILQGSAFLKVCSKKQIPFDMNKCIGRAEEPMVTQCWKILKKQKWVIGLYWRKSRWL